ncbi:hypothetical protein A3742_10230 [Oleiphilus sp. HI0071]|uniref:DUF4344 domain-containing metallopeptidase n=2 Tax=Oleiphilus TaxID=141450 RepID=UPI0007C2689E|nr:MULTISPECIES: DUF4344 domain-containing metallopeptidase [unclassified Oleiphilus]KZY68243.1 hypothetical protein A3737_02705 [Oleiphilus sp. HI0065]KZY82231.1 hypothetical protein A3742_10230 [Oleiphilus sp. HI0071]KZZ06314.1 hypothetical protein A3744_00600 [Oleiphilus sp. HI0073]KZZ42938.1 hypothetical protein A3758_05040 [Oleiphilus sp. HI0118]KZZ49518.1 hypothetical protein A3760_21190 [Oleiphilus sp. HI0122]KZZ71097.1 hypothetical protein A3765_15225 [Oleiphilus sp. HI0130]KZZ77506.
MYELSRKIVLCLLCGVAGLLWTVQVTVAQEGAVAEEPLVRWSEQAMSLDHEKLFERLGADFERPLRQLVFEEIALQEAMFIEVSERPYGYYDPDARLVVVPLSNIYRAFDDLKARFPQQEGVQQSILSAALQFYLMSELIRGVVIDLELKIVGWDAERIDALVTVMLLESSVVDQPYLLDAAEEFLLIDRAAPSIQSQRFKTEFEADEYRLMQVLCVMKAYDSEETAAPVFDRRECTGQYEAALTYWADVLAAHLRENSRLKEWASQPEQDD